MGDIGQNQEVIVAAGDIRKEYKIGKVTIHALQGVSFEIRRGSFCAFVGESGSGKTTTLHIIGGLTNPTAGRILINGYDIARLKDKKLSLFRNRNIGFIFQDFNLIDVYTASENIAYPLHLARAPRRERRKLVEEMLDRVGMPQYGKHKPTELSGGQKQRVAIARALVNKPQLVLADEPTANLDSQTGEKILQLMLEINQKLNVTFVVATHSPRVMQYAGKIFTLKDGLLTA